MKGNDKKYKGDSISNLLLVQDLNVLNIEFFPQMEQLKHQIMRWKIWVPVLVEGKKTMRTNSQDIGDGMRNTGCAVQYWGITSMN